jgi:hypothetical protein
MRSYVMRAAKLDVPVSFASDGVELRETEWGAMNIALESFPAGINTAPLFKGLPDDRCQCPHWGHVVRGRMRVHYADREEILETGDVYYLAPGHTTSTDEPTELIEFSPRGEYQKTLEVVARNLAAMQGQ